MRKVLEELDLPVIDRAGIEQIFGVRRRRAIQLMHKFGGYQAARTCPYLPSLPSFVVRADGHHRLQGESPLSSSALVATAALALEMARYREAE
ncbi:MAG: hypothetical protein JNK87_39055 [Bryobacterales bacterium]|nr:hypothetical protein [Bryobacterales bacterium]